MIYSLGCDVSKDEHAVCLLRYELTTQQWEVIAHKSFANNPGGSKALLAWVNRLTKNHPAPVRCTMEATGVYYEQLALYIQEYARHVHISVVLPSKAKSYQASRGLRNKTDKTDAFGLAVMGAERTLEPWKGIDVFWRTLRQLTRTRSGLVKQITEVRNQLHALCHSGIAAEQAEASLNQVLETMEEQQQQLQRQITRHLGSRTELAPQIACLKSIPGVGTKTIAVILAETLGFEYFTSVAQLMSYSGYDVVANESGKRVGTRSISKQGSPHIRQAMYMPASTIVRRKPPEIYRIYQRLVDKHSIKMKAHVAVQKKLLTYMYILWNKKECFDPDIIRNQRKEHQKKVAPPESEATVDTPLVLT